MREKGRERNSERGRVIESRWEWDPDVKMSASGITNKLRRDEQTRGTHPMSNLSTSQDFQERWVKMSYGMSLRNEGMCVRSSLQELGTEMAGSMAL